MSGKTTITLFSLELGLSSIMTGSIGQHLSCVTTGSTKYLKYQPASSNLPYVAPYFDAVCDDAEKIPEERSKS